MNKPTAKMQIKLWDVVNDNMIESEIMVDNPRDINSILSAVQRLVTDFAHEKKRVLDKSN